MSPKTRAASRRAPLPALIVFTILITACGGAPAPTPTAPPTPTPAAVATARPEPTAAGMLTISPLREVPRARTLVLGRSITSPIGVTNPWAADGYTHQEGNAFLWEPLAYFGIFGDRTIPWLADSMEYTRGDFTELTIKLNPRARWSDGAPVTARDVAFTFEGQLHDERLPYHALFQQFVAGVEASDSLTVKLRFSRPAPRFKFEVLTLKFDSGIPIVPEHALSRLDDVGAYPGGVEIPHSGPYNLVAWDESKKIYDLREGWWAVEAGLAPRPAVERIVIVNLGGQVGRGMELAAQGLANNELDSSQDLSAAAISALLEQNPKITTHTGNAPPYGYLDWWPNALWVNTQLEPYSDVRVRRAISRSIDRAALNRTVYEGAEVATVYPFPLYPGLQAFVDTPEVKDLIGTYQPGTFDPAEAEALMAAAGFARNEAGLWEREGQTVKLEINGLEGIHGEIVPVLAEMLRAAGFDAGVNFGASALQNMVNGAPGAYMFGQGASLRDPYAALELFHSRHSAPPGSPVSPGYLSRYANPELDALLDAMAPLDSGDPTFHADAARALEIYWRDQINIPVVQWLHRIPYNQTYWTNWPTADNLAMGVNGAFWAHTGTLVVTALRPAE